MEKFTFNHLCVFNDNYTVMQDVILGMLSAVLADMAANGIPWYDLTVFRNSNWPEQWSAMHQAAFDCLQKASNRPSKIGGQSENACNS